MIKKTSWFKGGCRILEKLEKIDLSDQREISK